MRDSAGLTPDFAGLSATPALPEALENLDRALVAVKADQSFKCSTLCHTDLMHLVPTDRAHRRIIDAERVCRAISSLDPDHIRDWSERFALLSDPTRLSLLLCINAAGPISVSDLAAAVNQNTDTVSQTLRLLRANHTVTGQRDGRVIRYQLADPTIRQLLAFGPSHD